MKKAKARREKAEVLELVLSLPNFAKASLGKLRTITILLHSRFFILTSPRHCQTSWCLPASKWLACNSQSGKHQNHVCARIQELRKPLFCARNARPFGGIASVEKD